MGHVCAVRVRPGPSTATLISLSHLFLSFVSFDEREKKKKSLRSHSIAVVASSIFFHFFPSRSDVLSIFEGLNYITRRLPANSWARDEVVSSPAWLRGVARWQT